MLSNYLSYFGLATFCIISIITGVEFKPIIPLIVQFVHNNLILNFYDVSLIAKGGPCSPPFFVIWATKERPINKNKVNYAFIRMASEEISFDKEQSGKSIRSIPFLLKK